MLPLFALRLALGLMGSLLLLSPEQINPRFYRTHFLTAVGLAILAFSFLIQGTGGMALPALGAVLCFGIIGAISWSLEGAPGGRTLIVLTLIALGLSIWWMPLADRPVARHLLTPDQQWPQPPLRLLLNDLTSALFLGLVTTAMLMGHSYLIAPSMSMTPLMRLLFGLFIAIGLRAIVAGIALWHWSEYHSLFNLKDITVLWLPIRWGPGLVGPAVLTFMAWRCGKIRSTQSATGIMYIAVVLCFLGELVAQLLLSETGYPL